MRAAAVALLVASAAASAADHPPRAQRLAQCAAAGKTGNHSCFTAAAPQKNLPGNLWFGWNVGAAHPSSDTDPPSYDKLLNGLDQCAWYHDRGAFRWNPRTRLCESFRMCASAVGLLRCVERYQPETKDEAEAKRLMLRMVELNQACVPKLYADYGAEYARDRHGSQWLSPRAERELAEAFQHCPPQMATPGWTPAK